MWFIVGSTVPLVRGASTVAIAKEVESRGIGFVGADVEVWEALLR